MAERDALPKAPEPLRFSGHLTGEAGGDLAVAIRGLRVDGAAPGAWRVRVDTLDLPVGGMLPVAGPNGSGKSSLLSVLAGDLALLRGNWNHPPVRGRVRQ